MSDSKVIAGGPVATMCEGAPYGLMAEGAIAISGGVIDWVGPLGELPDAYRGC